MTSSSSDAPFNLSPNNPITDLAEVRPSGLHGLGVFAKKHIPAGTVWWHARPQDVVILTRAQYLVLYDSFKPPLIRDYIRCLLTYAYYDANLDALIFCLDNARFVNHSPRPNSALDTTSGLRSVALRDIEAGEEITENYSLYKKCSWAKAPPEHDMHKHTKS